MDFAAVRAQFVSLPVAVTPDNIRGKTYIVTGANTGLGKEAARHLIARGTAGLVVMAVRSRAKGEAALAEIRAGLPTSANGGSRTEVWEVDLASLDSVERFCMRVAGLERLDGLIENAGVAMGSTSFVTEPDGRGGPMELTLQVNLLGTFLMAVRCYPKLHETAQHFGTNTHLVIVSSGAGIIMAKNAVDGVPSNVFDTFNDTTKSNMSSSARYPLSKILQAYAVREMAALLPVDRTGVVINVVNPGLCTTELNRDAPRWLKLQIAVARFLMARTAEEGSRTLLHAAVAGVESHGTLMSECKVADNLMPENMSSSDGRKVQKQVWNDLLECLNIRGHGVDMARLSSL